MAQQDESREELERLYINKCGEFDSLLLSCVRYSKKKVSVKKNAGLHEIIFPVDVKERNLTCLNVIRIKQPELKDVFNRIINIKCDNDILDIATDYGNLYVHSFDGLYINKKMLQTTKDTLEDWYQLSADIRCVMQIHASIREEKPNNSFTREKGMIRFKFTDGEETDYIKKFYRKFSIPESIFLEYHRGNFFELGMFAITKILNENLARAHYRTAVYLHLDEEKQHKSGTQVIEYQRSLDLFSLVWRTVADTVNKGNSKDKNAWYRCRGRNCGLYDQGKNMRISNDGKTAIHVNCYNADKQAEKNYYRN